MSNAIFYTRHTGGLTLFMDGKLKTVSSDHPNFDQILESLKAEKYERVLQLMDIVTTVNALGANVPQQLAGRKVFVEDGVVYFTDSKGEKTELHGTLVDRILNDIGKPSVQKYAEALLQLQDNIMQNKHKDIRDELYEFLMSGKTPITMDGCFLAYKKVKAPNSKGEYLDIYSGTMDNAPGKIPRIAENRADTNRHNVCSTGLHFCSKGYLGSYGGGRGATAVVVVKVNPKHVVAIPTDYSFQKGRATEYYVVGVTKDGWDSSVDAFKDSFIDEDTKDVAAPHVSFSSPLRAGLEKMAESYGLVKDGKCWVIENNGAYIPVRELATTPSSIDSSAAAEVEKRIKKVFAEQLGLQAKDIKGSDNIIGDLGADSLDLVELVMALEDEFETDEHDDQGLEKILVVQDAIDLIFKELKVLKTADKYVDIMGTPVAGDPKLMAFETKSVRAAVKAAVQKAQGS